MGVFQFFREQYINSTVDELWEFISSPQNLKKITPPNMGFNIITEHLSEKMYPGMIIGYQVSPVLNIKTLWVTEITQVVEKSFFVDEQRIGPYKMWHHEHRIIQQEKGVLMTDLITYQPPFGILGTMANKLFISNKLAEIFDYRRTKIIEYFPE